MNDPDKFNTFHHMHQFYAQEAHHQRTMMWDTVKWFTPILTLIAGGWVKYYIDVYLSCRNISILSVLIGLSIFGLCLCLCCIWLLRSFYRTNLKYITMFAKVEEELNFDKRISADLEYFPGDEYITWEEYRESRKGHEPQIDKNEKPDPVKYTSKRHVQKKLHCKLSFEGASIFDRMNLLFYIFVLFFIGCILLLIINP